jgi:hypothetical protein
MGEYVSALLMAPGALRVVLATILLCFVAAIGLDVWRRSTVTPEISRDRVAVVYQTDHPLNVLQQGICGTTSTSNHCGVALSMIRQTAEILERSKSAEDAYAQLDARRATLTNPITRDYVFVDKRSVDPRTGRASYMTIFTRKELERVPARIKHQRLLRSVPNSDLLEQLRLSYARTRPAADVDPARPEEPAAAQGAGAPRRYAIQEYPWIDAATGEPITKRSILYRYDEDTIIGSGFSVVRQVVQPDRWLVAKCLAIYVGFFVFGFVYPGVFLERTLAEFPRAYAWAFLAAFTVVYGLLVFQQCRNINRYDATPRARIIEFLDSKRYIAIALAGLAVALGFFATHQEQESANIMPALFAGLVFSLAAMLDFFLGNTNDAYKAAVHLCNTFITCSVTSFVWLFALLYLKYSLLVRLPARPPPA